LIFRIIDNLETGRRQTQPLINIGPDLLGMIELLLSDFGNKIDMLSGEWEV